jgi:proteasome lid subunit RPN8/RPN11
MINEKIKNYIKKHAEEEEPNEACGFIVLENNEFKCIKCKNISNTPNLTFEISSKICCSNSDISPSSLNRFLWL